MLVHLTIGDVATRLRELGYIGQDVDVTPTAVKRHLKRFQRFHDLDVTGELDPATTRLLTTPLRCGSPDMLVTDTACRWPMTDMQYVSYYSELRLPGLAPDAASAIFDEACRQWEAVCGIRLKRIATAKKANIAAKSGTGRTVFLDGRGGTLAWSYLPCGATAKTQLSQMYDQAERWSNRMALAVMCHEVGHALGLSHAKPGQLMAPYYNADVTKPQAGDIAEMVKLYGPASRQGQTASQVIRVNPAAVIEIRSELDDSLLMTLQLPSGE